MPNYDFATLSPTDFEYLTRDLLQSEWGVHLESFKNGRDKGIDLRYSKGTESKVVVQCKHSRQSSFSSLRNKLKREELPKIQKLNPERYVVSTSLPLSPMQKDQLVDVLHPFCKDPSDIFSASDLNNLLGKYPSVERQHFKLWLPSTEVLTRLLANGVFTRSAFEVEDIRRRFSLFVPTPAVERAAELLDKHGYCLLSGIPGIGKTTTAEILVAQLVEQGWTCVVVSGSVDEAFSVYRSGEKQIFVYDDFLGQTSLTETKLQKNEDKKLLQLIESCNQHRKSKRIILTTREYILEQAQRQHEQLKRSEMRLAECVVRLADYERRIRAQILVNHLYFYNVHPTVCRRFVESGKAKKTIVHRNYNPRVVESICKLQAKQAAKPEDFGDLFLELLEQPREIWAHAFHNQLSPDSRQLLKLFALLGSQTMLSVLESRYRLFCTHTSGDLFDFSQRFRDALKDLEGNFVEIVPDAKAPHVVFHNPSVKDFTDEELKAELYFLTVALQSLDIDEALQRATTLLLERSDARIDGTDLLAAINRAKNCSQHRVHSFDGYALPYVHASRSARLAKWLRILLKVNQPSVVVAFLNTLDPDQVNS